MRPEMRRKNTGTHDKQRKLFEIRGKVKKISYRQLAEHFGVEVPVRADEAVKLWNRYLAERNGVPLLLGALKKASIMTYRQVEDAILVLRRLGHDASHLEEELASLKARGGSLTGKEGGLPVSIGNGTAFLTLHLPASVPVRHLDAAGVDIEVNRQLGTEAGTPIEKKDTNSVSHHIDSYLCQSNMAKRKDLNEVKNALYLFRDVAGDVDFRSLNLDHWQSFHAAVDAKWASETTRHRRQGEVERFLKRLAKGYDVRYGFLEVNDLKREEPDGSKEQWTLEQVKAALAVATGHARLALLLG